jgi:hypothetical protein
MLEYLALGCFLLCAVLGVYLWLGTPFWPLYFGLLDVHIWAGALFAIISAPSLIIHLRRYRAPFGRFHLATGALLVTGAVLVVVRDDTPFEGYLVFALGLILLGAALPLGIAALLYPKADRERASPRPGRHGFSLTLATVLCLSLGVMALVMRSDEAQVPRQYHSAAGILLVFLLIGHLPIRFLPERTPRWLLVLLCVSSLIFWNLQYHDEHTVEIYKEAVVERWQTAVSPANSTERADPSRPHFELDAEAGSASCGTAGCHEALFRQWQGSAHRFSADNDFYRKVVALLVEERGVDEAVFCASCHDPVRVFAGTVQEAYAQGAPPPGEGVSCIGCHVALDAQEPYGNGVVQFRKPRPYPGASDERRAHNIARDPRFHMRNFLVEHFHIHGPSCLPCHRLELSEDMGSHASVAIQSVLASDYPPGNYPAAASPGPSDQGEPDDLAQVKQEYYGNTGCIECHLVTPATIGEHLLAEDGYRGAYGIYPHSMTGLNLDLALYVSHPDADQDAIARVRKRAQAFLAGDVQEDCVNPTIRPDNDTPSPFSTRTPAARDEGVVTLDLYASRAEDGSLALRTETWNLRAAHPFPIGPFDLFEVWQEVLVTGSDGEPLLRRGFVDDSHRVDPEAHRLGARELNSDGQPIEKHRIWTIAEVVDKRVIQSGSSVEDSYRVVVPEGASGPFSVEVAWRLRRANQDFVDWVYDADGTTFPIHDMARARMVVQ